MSDLLQFRGYELPVSLVMKTGSGTGNFEKIADWHVSQLQKYVGIKSTDSVVEIGCGIGRIAIPLTEMLTKGRYLGTEVIRPSVDWLTENISAKYNNFRFVHHDIHDTLHNPNGTMHAADIRLPVDDKSVDVIFLQSVFTHMMEEEIVHYMREFSRILKPEGRVSASCFLVNDNALNAVRDAPPAGWSVQFKYPIGDRCYINSEQEPRAAVAFEDDKFMSMIEAGGLQVDQILWGAWSGTRENARSGQDVAILKP